MINVHAVGRLTKNVDLRYSRENNRAVANFYLACKKRSKDDRTTFIKCVAFDKAAEILEKYTCKGVMLEIMGELTEEEYVDSNGISKKYMQIIVDKFEILESKEMIQKRREENRNKNVDYSQINVYDQSPFEGMSDFGYFES